MENLLRTFLAIKAVSIAVLLSATAFFPFNDSTELLFPQKSIWTKLLEPFIRWDAVYYFLIARDGYVHEKMHAFYPFYPYLMKYLAHILPFGDCDYKLVLSGILISNLSHLVSYISLYHLTLHLFGDYRMAYQSSIFFLIQPASIHMTTLFSEGTFAALVITGMWSFVHGYDAAAAILFSLSGLVRSNGILLSGFFLYRSVFLFKTVRRLCKDVTLALISASGGCLYLLSCHQKYCTREEKAEWCYRTIPNIYSYIQAKYWKVGAFNYYTTTQLPNFVIALPMLALSFYGLVVNADFLLFRSKQKLIIPFYYLWMALLMFSLVFVHIQVINRLFSFLPPVFWTLSRLYQKVNNQQKRMLLCVFGVYYTSISFMIACFYPPA